MRALSEIWLAITNRQFDSWVGITREEADAWFVDDREVSNDSQNWLFGQRLVIVDQSPTGPGIFRYPNA
jgi:hypothetical protein